jgi:hypothetical protein
MFDAFVFRMAIDDRMISRLFCTLDETSSNDTQPPDAQGRCSFCSIALYHAVCSRCSTPPTALASSSSSTRLLRPFVVVVGLEVTN